jgi:hypothetical protein
MKEDKKNKQWEIFFGVDSKGVVKSRSPEGALYKHLNTLGVAWDFFRNCVGKVMSWKDGKKGYAFYVKKGDYMDIYHVRPFQ